MAQLRRLIRKIIEEQGGFGDVPKGRWLALSPGSDEFNLVRHQLYNLIEWAYEDIGGHIKISGKGPASLDRYKFWAVVDHDDDPDIDLAIFGKPEYGAKSGGVGHDGSPESVGIYKNKSAELRKGGTVGGIGNWWGEVSGKAAYALIKRGAPAVEDPEEVAKLLAGDSYEWHGEHPSENAPEVFKKVKGWYTKDFGRGGKHTKIILGVPSA